MSLWLQKFGAEFEFHYVENCSGVNLVYKVLTFVLTSAGKLGLMLILLNANRTISLFLFAGLNISHTLNIWKAISVGTKTLGAQACLKISFTNTWCYYYLLLLFYFESWKYINIE